MDGPLFPPPGSPPEPAPEPNDGQSGGRRILVIVGVLAAVAVVGTVAVLATAGSDGPDLINAAAATTDADDTTTRTDPGEDDEDDEDDEAAEVAAECQSTLKTLQVAVEAHVAVEGEYPSDEADLVDAGLIRDETELYDVDDGRVVIETGTPCGKPSRQVLPPLPTTTTSTTTTIVDAEAEAEAEACTVIVEAVIDADLLPDDATDAATALDSLDRMIDELWDMEPEMTEAQALALEDLLYYLEEISGPGREALLVGGASGAPEVMTASNEFVLATMRMFLRSDLIHDWVTALALACPDVIDSDPPMATYLDFVEATAVALGHVDRLDQLGQPQVWETIMTPADVADFRAMVEESIGTPQSAYLGEYATCYFDQEASNPGENPACDVLVMACGGGDLLACNDLYNVSNYSTEYESIGRTCGGRASAQDDAYAGTCELLG